jgi:hypothetical protein
MARDITVQVAVRTNPDGAVIETRVTGGDEAMRADMMALIITHLDMLWGRLTVADRIKLVGRQPKREHRR